MTNNLALATVGGGCFWCTEAIFQSINGVEKVVSGYSGGTVPGVPTYIEVCSGLTGHAEVVQITFDTSVISYKEILTIFMITHNPTTPNRQGADVGSQYRSVIFFHSELQRQTAKALIEKMASYYDNPIITELVPLQHFFEAEAEHQDYYSNHPTQGYCTVVIAPKLNKLRKLYNDKLKKI